ncbi:MAG TPA: TraR/DksA family transcriptional regulator [Candidatus Acidoferrales bacterium]|jgi:DnaK suppressor protein|nr:TraR/DksA family transcriptional regulator [Candidatus Acidoferrales bacterium]
MNAAKPKNKKYEAIEKSLIEQRDELRRRLSDRMTEVHIDREPDDEAALASDSSSKEMAVATLERERRTLAEIEAALLRMKKGEYGMCASCGEPIPEARLKALPWARVCVKCAERRSNGLAAD